jgi:plastocyanin
MPRPRLFLLLAFATIATVVPASSASAGGGCHSGATQGTGDTVEMQDACFTPSTLQAEPGATITFINTDPFDHNVSGNGWGEYGTVAPGDRLRVTFDAEGIYAYACTLHPGMTGSVVVGDGDGPGNGAVVVGAGQDPGAPAATQPRATESTGDGWLLPSAIALVLGVGLGFGLARLRRRDRVREAVVAGA